MDVVLPNGVTISGIPDGTTKEQVMQKAIQAGLAKQEDFGAPTAEKGMGQKIDDAILSNPIGRGISEFASSVNRGAVGVADILSSPVRYAVNAIDQGTLNPMEGFEGAAMNPLGYEMDQTPLSTRGNFMEDGLAKDIIRQGGEMIPGGVLGGSIMRSASQAAPLFSASGNAAAPLAQQSVGAGALQQMGGSTLGQDALYSAISGAGGAVGAAGGEAVGGETGAQVGALLGSIAAPASVAVGSGLVRGSAQQSDEIAQRLARGETTRDLAKYQLDPKKLAEGAAKAIKDPQAKEAIKQGFDDGVISAIKASNKESKQRLFRMAKIAEKAKKDALFGSENRPSDIAGDSIAERLNHIQRVNSEAGKQLDDVAKTLKGKPADFETPSASFYSQLDDMGVTVGENGNLNFIGSDIEGIAGAEKIIKQVASRVSRVNADDAYDMHRLKRFIDEQVTYGKSTEGLSGKAERVLKSLRANIDSSLDNEFPEYDRVNTQYSDTINAIDEFQDVAGKRVILFGENADKSLGTKMRGLLSNMPSRAPLMNSIKKLDVVSQKYGAKFEDDLMTQMLFADELDKMFGTQARTSLQGDVGKATARGLQTATGQRSISGLAIDAAAAGAEKVQGINEENAFKAITDLLKREIK